MEGTTSLNAYIEDAINIMTEEIELINIWAKSAERVRKNIDRYPREYYLATSCNKIWLYKLILIA